MATGKQNVTVLDGASFLGEVCNNPLNIMESGDKWQALAGYFRNSAGGYCVFGAKDGVPGWVWGYRAAFVDWQTKQRRWGSLTLWELIKAWAPAAAKGHNNDPKAYARRVSKECGVGVDEQVPFNDRRRAIAVARAMTVVECTRCIYSDADIGRGWDLAHGVAKPKPIAQSNTARGVVVAGASTAVAGVKAVDDATGGSITAAIAGAAPHLQAAGGIGGWIGAALAIVALAGLGYALWRLIKDRQPAAGV